MKKALVIALTVFMGMAVMAQDTAPAAVSSAFKAQFSSATEAEWYEYDDGYEVQFMLGDMSASAMYTSTGKLVYSKEELTKSQLPAAVVSAVKAKYSNLPMYDFYKKDAGKGKVTYLVTVETVDFDNIYLELDEAGTIKKEILPMDVKDEDDDE